MTYKAMLQWAVTIALGLAIHDLFQPVVVWLRQR